MYGVVGDADAPGTEVEFRYWNCAGALTLDSWKTTVAGRGAGARVDFEAFTRAFSNPSPALQGPPSYVHFVLRRADGRWELRATWRETAPEAPPEAKQLPAEVPGLPSAAFEELRHAARAWLPLLRVSGDETAQFEFKVDLHDGRLTGAGLKERVTPANGNSRPIAVPVDFESRLASALIPFAQGIGPASVVIRLQPSGHRGEQALSWRVTSAAVVRPAREELDEPFTRYTEYRLLHEEIIRRWRSEVGDSVRMAAAFTGEQVAWWIVGGVAARGVSAVLELSAGPLVRVLGRGGAEAAGWLESLMVRLPEQERGALTKLWLKLETEGLEAFTAAERNELRAFFQRLDALAQAPLTKEGADGVRELARSRRWSDLWRQDPELARRLLKSEIHHRWPIEYAHLAPELDINGASELVAINRDVHTAISNVWTGVRKHKNRLTASDVHEVIAIIDHHFQRWYNIAIDKAAEAPRIQAATDAALMEVGRLFAQATGP